MQPTLIYIYQNNKKCLYSVDTSMGIGVFESEIKEFDGKKYYSHRGINHLLPKYFQGKRPICKL